MEHNSDLSDEIEALKAIYPTELQLLYPENTSVVRVVLPLLPSTAMDTDKQYVKATLQVDIDSQSYPTASPKARLFDIRGLDEECIGKLEAAFHNTLKDAGQPVISALIELVRETLTENNHPAGDCPVCLRPFMNGPFVKTGCYHFFHVDCLHGCVEYQISIIKERESVRKQLRRGKTHKDEDLERIQCPVCRTSLDPPTLDRIQKPSNQLHRYAQDGDNEVSFELPQEILELQAKMQAVLEKQRAAGGLIDLEENQRRLMVKIPPLEASPTENSALVHETTEVVAESSSQPHQEQLEDLQPAASSDASEISVVVDNAVVDSPVESIETSPQTAVEDEHVPPPIKAASLAPPPGFAPMLEPQNNTVPKQSEPSTKKPNSYENQGNPSGHRRRNQKRKPSKAVLHDNSIS